MSKRPTTRQLKARQRNFDIFRLRGMIATLDNIIENDSFPQHSMGLHVVRARLQMIVRRKRLTANGK